MSKWRAERNLGFAGFRDIFDGDQLVAQEVPTRYVKRILAAVEHHDRLFAVCRELAALHGRPDPLPGMPPEDISDLTLKAVQAVAAVEAD